MRTHRQWLWDFDIMQGIYLINHVHNARYLFLRMNLFSVCKCTCPRGPMCDFDIFDAKTELGKSIVGSFIYAFASIYISTLIIQY